METAKNNNLLRLSSQLLAESEMKNVYGSGVACHPSNCKGDIGVSVTNCLNNMRDNNPPINPPINPQ